MKTTIQMRIFERLRPWLRLWAIYNELGYIPWKKPKVKKERKKKGKGGVYMGAREAIPFMNDDAKRTFSHLLLRPGYMMRDYVLRGQHERYLAPITALLVFYSVFTLIIAVIPHRVEADNEESANHVEMTVTLDDSDSPHEKDLGIALNQLWVLFNLDQHPEAVDTPWKASLAAVEGDLRSKGFYLFIGYFLLLWISMSFLLRKYGISVSGAAAASAYVLCQYCIFKFLALLLSLGENAKLGILLTGILLFIDYRQMLAIGNRKAVKLTIKTGLFVLLVALLLGIIVTGGLLTYAYFKK